MLSNNRYNSNAHTDSSTDTPVSNKSTSNGLMIHHHNNNNNNHNNNNSNNVKKHKRNAFVGIRHKKARDESHKEKSESEREKMKKSQRNFSLNLKQTLCNIFRFRRLGSPDHFVEKRNSIVQGEIVEEEEGVDSDQHANNNNTAPSEVEPSAQKLPFFKRALPPLPKSNNQVGVEQAEEALTAMAPKCESPSSVQQQVPPPVVRPEEDIVEDTSMDFAASIEKVKDVCKFCSFRFSLDTYELQRIILWNIAVFWNSTDGIGDLYPVKRQKRYYPMNRMDHLLCETVVTIITFFPCHSDSTVVCDT